MTAEPGDRESALPDDEHLGEASIPLIATAVTEVRPEGQMLTGAVLTYPVEIDGAQLQPECFEVAGRSVTEVFTATDEDLDVPAPSGRNVVVRLSPDDPEAALRMKDPPPSASAADRPPLRLGQRAPFPEARYRTADVAVRQVGALHTTTPALVPGPVTVRTTRVRHRVVSDFVQSEFHDPATGDVLPYNLFLPVGHERGGSYPLVLFMHDAGSTGDDPLTTLRQGIGATIWAQQDEQAERPCLVLAPQYSTVIVNDASEASSALETTVNLVREIAREHPVDRSRIYVTGQSGGAMMAIAMNIAHPDLFAASLIVAGQWDADKSVALARQKLWIVVSEGDIKAFPGQNAITQALERRGATVERAIWDARLPPAALDQAAQRLAASAAPIKYAILRRGTVVPAGQPDSPIANHTNTWRVAYTLPAIREWLFRQSTAGTR